MIKGFKFEQSDSGLLWLIWKYGFGEILAWVPDHIWQNSDPLSPFTPDFEPPLHFAKALIVLSDSWRLGDSNVCFPVRLEHEIGATFVISADTLSEHMWQIIFEEVLEIR